MRVWGRLSAAQRTACVAFIASFAALMLGSLFRSGQPVGEAGWSDWSLIVLLAAVPAAAMALSWWIASTTSTSPAIDADGPDRRQLLISQRLAVPLTLGLTIVTRELNRRIPTALRVAVLVWWLVAIVVMFVVIPRLLRSRA